MPSHTRCTHKSFTVFVVKETNHFQGNFIFCLFKDWPSASTHFDHLSGKLWIPCQKNFLFCGKTFVESLSHFFEIAEVLLGKRVSHWCEEVIVRCHQVKGLQQGRKDVPPKRFQGVSPVLMCETGHCHVTKSLGHVSWPIPVVFRSMRDSN
jgi:hypothetical protein